ncbi:AraC family transcriptional regulator [Streptomyces pseudoechinosporeus]
MDALADVLSTSRAGGTLLAWGSAHAPWGLGTPPGIDSGTTFHAIVSGACWLLIEDEDPRQLVAGDVVVLPRHRYHALASDPSAPVRRLDACVPGEVVIEGTGGCTRFLSGSFDFDPELAHPLTGLLPPVLVASADSPGHDELHDVVRLLSRELDRDGLGSSLAADRLVDVLLIHVMRVWILGCSDHQASWLTALRDPDIANVLAIVHARPHLDWTVGSLAREAGLSRATLARRFTQLVGTTPAAYLTSWRMEVAAQRLRTTSIAIDDIARTAGYTSQAAFSRAFVRARGVPPGRYRQQATAKTNISQTPALANTG